MRENASVERDCEDVEPWYAAKEIIRTDDGEMRIRLTAKDALTDFYAWLENRGGSVLRLHCHQAVLAECDEVLPEEVCEKMEVPRGSTVGHLLRSMIPMSIENEEYVLLVLVDFDSEEESRRWWRATEGEERWQMEYKEEEQTFAFTFATVPADEDSAEIRPRPKSIRNGVEHGVKETVTVEWSRTEAFTA